MIKTCIGVTVAGTLECLDKNMYYQTANYLKENFRRLHSDQTLHYSFVCLIQELAKADKTLTKNLQQISH